MSRKVLWKRVAAVGLTAAMLMTSVSAGFAAEEPAVQEESAEAQESVLVESTVAGFDDVLEAADDLEEEFYIEEESVEDEDSLTVEDLPEQFLEASAIVEDEEPAVYAQDGYYDLDMDISYGESYSPCLYTDTPLTLTVIDQDTWDEFEVPEGYTLNWEISYECDGNTEKPAFITEAYNEEKTQLTLTADVKGFKEHQYLSVSATLLCDEDSEVYGNSSRNVMVLKEQWNLNSEFADGQVYNWKVTDGHWFEDTAEFIHYYSQAQEGEYVDIPINSITASNPQVIKVVYDDDEEMWNVRAINAGTSAVTITALPGGGETFTFTFTVIVSAENYELELHASVPWGTTVLPGIDITVTKEITGSYYEYGEYYDITDFSNLNWEWSVEERSGAGPLPFTQSADGITIQTDGGSGYYEVLCTAKKNGREVAQAVYDFNVLDGYAVVEWEARSYDEEDGEGEIINLSNLPAGETAIVHNYTKWISSEHPEGELVENITYALNTWDSDLDENVSFYEYNEDTGLGDSIAVSANEEVFFTGDSYAVTRNSISYADWTIQAYENYDPETGSYSNGWGANLSFRELYEDIDEWDLYLNPSYGDEEDLYLFTDTPLTLELRDYEDESRDFSDCTIEWAVQYPANDDDDDDEQAYVDADDLVEWTADGTRITLNVQDDWSSVGRRSFCVCATVCMGEEEVGSTSTWIYIEEPGIYPDIYEYIGDDSFYVGDSVTVPTQMRAWVENAQGSGYQTVQVKGVRLASGNPDSTILSVTKISSGWTISCKKEGQANLELTYADPKSGSNKVYPFSIYIQDNVDVYRISIKSSKNGSILVDKEKVTLSYTVEAKHISGGVWSTIPATAYKVKWDVNPEDYVTTSQSGGKLTLTAKYPQYYDEEDDSPEVYATATVYPRDSEEHELASDDIWFAIYKEYYSVECSVKSPNGFTSLQKLPVGEVATVTPSVKHHDSAHPGGVTVSGDIRWSEFDYYTDLLEVKTASGAIIEADSSTKIKTPYFTVKRKKADSTYLEFSAYMLVTESYETTWRSVGWKSFDLDTVHDCTRNGHTLRVTKAKQATTTSTGNIQYWYCTTCHKYFKDAAGKQQITKAKTITPKLPSEKITITKTPSGVKAKSTKKKQATVSWKKFKETKKTKAIWKKVKKVEIQYSLDKSFKTGVSSKLVNKKKTSVTIKKLLPNKTYYFRVRYYEGPLKVSKWCGTKKAKIKK